MRLDFRRVSLDMAGMAMPEEGERRRENWEKRVRGRE